MILKKVRLSFPSLWEKTSFGDNPDKKFEATFIFKKGDANHQTVLAELKKISDTDFGGKLSGEKQCSFLKDGSKKEYDGYGPGAYTVYARNKNRFPTVDADPTILVSPDDSPCKIYAGCYVNVKIGLYVWDNKFGKGVAASLNGVQFAGNGEPFAKKVDDDEEFETLDIAEEMTDSDFGF